MLELRAHQTALIGGTEASFTCYGRTLFLSNGFVWKLEEGGREQYLQGGNCAGAKKYVTLKNEIRVLDEKLGAGEDFVESSIQIRIPKNTIGPTRLTCYAPVWNSESRWESITLELGSRKPGSGVSSISATNLIFIFISLLMVCN